MPKSLRGLLAATVLVLLAGGLLDGLAARQHWLGKKPPRSPISDGYVVTLDASGAVAGPGTSVAPGETIGFALNAYRSQTFTPSITTPGGRTVATLPQAGVAPHQPATAAPWIDGPNYPVAFSWTVPEGLPSGVYYLNGLPDLFFIVRPAAHPMPPVAVLMPTHTLNAYSTSDGRSLYRQPVMVPAVTYLRPQQIEKSGEWTSFLRWVEAEKPFGAEPPAFIADADMEDPAILDGAKVLIVEGHSEYWTRRAREVLDAFIARGGDVIMAGGDDIWWQVRLSGDHRVLYEYRKDDTPENGGDPVADPKLRTVYWSNPKLDYPSLPSIGGSFLHGGYGQQSALDREPEAPMTVASPRSPLLAGLGLKDCGPLDEGRSTEWDGAPILGLDVAGKPVPDVATTGVSRLELIAYVWNRNGPHALLGTMHVLQRTPSSGYVLHMGGRGCCMGDGFYADPAHGKPQVQTILRNAVALFLTGGDPFTSGPAAATRPVAFPMTTPWAKDIPSVPQGDCAPRFAVPTAATETE